jgi:hypothetical protein
MNVLLRSMIARSLCIAPLQLTPLSLLSGGVWTWLGLRTDMTPHSDVQAGELDNLRRSWASVATGSLL